MPIYTYRCKHCQHTTELIQSMKEGEDYLKDGQYSCEGPDCGSTEGERLIGNTSFILSGNGWYAKGGY